MDDDRRKWGQWIGGRPVLGPIDKLPQIARNRDVEQLLFAIPRLPAARVREILAACAELKFRYKILPHGGNGRQFRYMVEWGMTPMQAIQAATVNAADLLGWQDKVGTIGVGKLADIIAVAADPLNDVAALEKVAFVMKNGVVVKNETGSGHPTPPVRPTDTQK